MQLSVHKDILFFFAIFWILGIDASAQSEPAPCALKVFVNDPFAQIFVDDQPVGAQPQMIACADQEKNIVVKSSDGQVFSRLMKSKDDFDLTNSTLNVVFHRKANDFVYGASANMQLASGEKPPAMVQNLPIASSVRDLSSTPLKVISPASRSKELVGTYVQIFALKNLDMSKIEQDMELHYKGHISEREFIICPRQNSVDAQTLSLILVGPFSKKSSAMEVRNRIGGQSFIVNNPKCSDDFTKVSR